MRLIENNLFFVPAPPAIRIQGRDGVCADAEENDVFFDLQSRNFVIIVGASRHPDDCKAQSADISGK